MNKVYSVEDFPLDEKTMMLHETLFHNANGYIGVRGTLEEGVPQEYNTMRGTYVNGFYDVIPMKQAESLCNLVEEKETMVNVADVQTMHLSFDGETFSLFSGEITNLIRTLDMEAGTTTRSMQWSSPHGHEVQIQFCRMASFTHKSVFTIACKVTSLNFDGELTVSSKHSGIVANYANPSDPRLAAEGRAYLRPQANILENGVSYLVTHTTKSNLELCTAVAHRFSKPGSSLVTYSADAHCYDTNYTCRLHPGETLLVEKYAVIQDSIRSDNCLQDAQKEIESVYGKLDALYQQQREYLSEFWKCANMEIDEDDESNLAIAFNMYQLLQSCGSDGKCGIAAKGLSGEGYEGHYFWDTDIYILPFFVLTNPALARGLLNFRYSTLDAARENAKLVGHQRGALFPWRTIHGKECSGYFPSGTAQYHITGDIAYAAVKYYLATGDTEYLIKEGAEILIETARLWCDVGNWNDGKFMINDVTGPDEYTCIVNNNYYTNACAKYNLNWAVKAANILRKMDAFHALADKLALRDEELDEFQRAADAMYLPYNEKLGINPQDDSFLQKPIWDLKNTPKENFPLLLHYHPLALYRHQVCKQADTVLAYYLFDGLEDRETVARSFAYYEPITTHDSSLSTCIFSIVASSLGEKEKAWDYFGSSVTLDLQNKHGNTGDGIHTANMGGSYMVIVNGFAGVRIQEDGLHMAPYLPAAWSGYRFQMQYRGSSLELSVHKTGYCISLLNDVPVTILLPGTSIVLDRKASEYVHAWQEG